MSEPSWIIEWFRPDRRREIWRVSGLAGSIVTLGALVVGLSRSGALEVGEGGDLVLGVIGAVATLGGPLIAVIGLTRVLGGDIYLAIRGDGVAYSSRTGVRVVSWDDLSDARAEGDRLVLQLETGEQVSPDERFDLTPVELAQRIVRTRQRALMGLLRPPVLPSGQRSYLGS